MQRVFSNPACSGVLKMPPGAAPVVFGMDPIWHGRKTEVG